MSLRAIFYDTETTGLRAGKDKIIEIAAYDPLYQKSFVQLINPGCPIPPEATEIHKISDAMVSDAPSFAQVAEQFVSFCSGDVVLIAHNNDAFDIHFLRAEFTQCNMALPGEWKFLDSLKWARRYRKDLPRHTLQFLREIYGIASNNAHRALDDVIILHQVFSHLTDDLSIDQVFTLLNEPKVLTHMPFGKHQGEPLGKVPTSYITWMKSNGAFDKAENQELLKAFQKLGKL
jgi:DNA polymerase-3 subunit epsilon